MADIAFLLLTFYMMTTEIKEYKGLTLMLPQYLDKPIEAPVNDRNLFTIRINSLNQCMVEGKPVENLHGLREAIKKFVMNNKKDPTLSDSPEEAVVSIKTDRGTSYKSFVSALDEAQSAYYEIYSSRVGISSSAFRNLDLRVATNKRIHDKARHGIPMNISIAGPSENVNE
jgi:biopolymer transport protein ExbD